MILLIGGEKGGTGKTTLAVNIATALAVSGKDVLVLDADPQASATRWAERRNTQQSHRSAVHCVQRTGDIRTAALDLAKRYAEVVIDAGGRDSRELRSAMLAAHRVYTPLRPSQIDLETALYVDELIKAAKASRMDDGPVAFAVLSMTPTHRLVTEADAARAYLTEYTQLQLSVASIAERKAYRDTMVQGMGVVEGENRQAIEEINALIKEIYQ